jgi:NAD(P)-dependent dehydrogenase (short-subunit alcohol dehydrogenase family)/maleate cis-trans isomerase
MDLFGLPRLGLVVPPGNPVTEPEINRLIGSEVNVCGARFPVVPDYANRKTFEMYNEVLPEVLDGFGGMRLEAGIVACNASHYLLNPVGDLAFCEELSARFGFPIRSSTQAILAVCHYLEIKSLALVSPYAPWLTETSRAYWEEAGIKVERVIALGDDEHFNPYEVTTKSLLDGVRGAKLPSDTTILFTGTGMVTLAALAELAREDDRRTLLTSNLASAWWVRRAVGASATEIHPFLRRLERKRVSASATSTTTATAKDQPTYDDLVAVISGGASGIGAAAAAALAAKGVRVAALDLKPDEAAAPAIGIECDVTDDASVRRAVAEVVERFGRIDIVVNNAGIGAQGDIAGNDDEEWHRVLDVNVVGMARLTRAALPYLRESPSAAIVNTSSFFAWLGVPQRTVYSASKGAVFALTLAMAADHVGESIRVNAVAPGAVDTPWIERLLAQSPDPAQARADLDARSPNGRLVRPEEVGEAIAYLATPASSATTGTILAVDGGIHGIR